MFAIVVNEKGGEQKRLEFDKPEVTIGRVQGNDIILPKGNVSKRHSRIVLKDGKFIIVDLKSTNGTYVNGRKITSPLVVKGSDKIYIGDFILSIEELAARGRVAPTTRRRWARGRARRRFRRRRRRRAGDRRRCRESTTRASRWARRPPPAWARWATRSRALRSCPSRCRVRRDRARCRPRDAAVAASMTSPPTPAPLPPPAAPLRRPPRVRRRQPAAVGASGVAHRFAVDAGASVAGAVLPAARRRVRRRRRRVRRSARPASLRRRWRAAPSTRRAGELRAGCGRRSEARAHLRVHARTVGAPVQQLDLAHRGADFAADDDLWARAESTAGQLVEQLSADGSLPAGVEPDALLEGRGAARRSAPVRSRSCLPTTACARSRWRGTIASSSSARAC